MEREQKRGRHRWNVTGPFTRSRDVRRCLKCGCTVKATGKWFGRTMATDDGRTGWYEKMPACPWPAADALLAAGGDGAK